MTDGLGYPDAGAGSNEQCLSMFFEGEDKTGHIKHDDQFRGVSHSYLKGIGCAGSTFNFVSPDFYQLVPWEGAGSKPVGYGYASVAATLNTIKQLGDETLNLTADHALEHRRAIMKEVDEKAIIATPANSSVNELVTEAARMSILRDGEFVDIVYGDNPHVKLRRG